MLVSLDDLDGHDLSTTRERIRPRLGPHLRRRIERRSFNVDDLVALAAPSRVLLA